MGGIMAARKHRATKRVAALEPTVRVFVGWSGDRSKAMAEKLRDWLSLVIQTSAPWVSTVDIASGAAWNQELIRALRAASYGILCVTEENYQSPWLNYECGVLAGALENNVCPLLLGVEVNALNATPLSRQQAQLALNKDHMLKLVKDINRSLETNVRVAEESVKAAFEKNWPDLGLDKLPASEEVQERGLEEKVDEMLGLLRAISQTLGDSGPPPVGGNEVQALLEHMRGASTPMRGSRTAEALAAIKERR
jgi:hypothetical protein